MVSPVWAESFEADAPVLLQAAYDLLDGDDAVQAIAMFAARVGEGPYTGALAQGVAYRIDGVWLDEQQAIGRVSDPGDPAALAAEVAPVWTDLFTAFEADAITSVELRYEVDQEDLRTSFGRDAQSADPVTGWRAGLA